MRGVEAVVEPELAESRTILKTKSQAEPEENSAKKEEGTQKSAPVKLNGMMVPYNRRPDSNRPTNHNSQSSIRNIDSDNDLDSSSDESKKRSNTQVAYTPLELDSDIESDLSSVGPKSRKRIPSKDYDQTQDGKDHPSSSKSSIKRRFPNPDHYEDPRRAQNSRFKDPTSYQDNSSKTNSSELTKKGQESKVPKQGNFNEVGIPIMDPSPDRKGNLGSTNTAHLSDVKSLIDRYEQNASQETLNEDQLSENMTEDMRSRPESKMGIPLVAMVPGRSPSRGQSSSGFGSLPDVQDKNSDSRSERLETPSPKNVAKGSKVPRQTDL